MVATLGQASHQNSQCELSQRLIDTGISWSTRRCFQRMKSERRTKPTVMLVKVGTLANSSKFSHHPELVAIQNLIKSTEKDYRFVFVGTTNKNTHNFRKGSLYEYDLKTGSPLTTLGYIFRLIFLLFKFRPKRVIIFKDEIFPVSLYCLLVRATRYSPFFVGGFNYYGYSRLGKSLFYMLMKLNWTFLRLSRFKLNSAFALSRYTMDGIIRNVPELRGIVQLVSYPISPIFKRVDRKTDNILMVNAGIEPRKGLHTLIQAMPLMNKNVHLIIKGDIRSTTYMLYLEKLVAELKLGNRITWNTNTIDDDELSKLYGKAKLFVFPTLEDALGVAVLEALFCGLPVVGTNNSGVTDMIIDRRNGILVPPNDPVRLAEAINGILNDEKLYRTLTQNTVRVLKDCYYRNRLTLEQAMKLVVEKDTD